MQSPENSQRKPSKNLILLFPIYACAMLFLMKGYVHIVAIIVIAIIVVLLLMFTLHVGPWAGSTNSTGGEKTLTSELI